MKTLKNISPIGTMFIPALGITVELGQTFKVEDDAIADSLLEQSESFEASKVETKTVETPATQLVDVQLPQDKE